MKAIIIALFILMMGFPLVGQQYFSKYYDLNNHSFEENLNVSVSAGVVHTYNFGICNEVERCHILANIAVEDGKLIGHFNHRNFDADLHPIIEEDFYIAGGDDFPITSRFFAFKSSSNGDSILQQSYQLDTVRYSDYYQKGALKYKNQYLLYGALSDQQDSVKFKNVWAKKVKGVVMWINQDLSLDTFTILEPEFQYALIRDAKMDHDSNLVLVYTMSRVFNGLLLSYRGVNKYNQDKQLIFHWETPITGINSGGAAIDIFEDNAVLLTYEDDYKINADTAIYSVLKIDTAGKTVWEYRFPTEYKKLYALLAAKLTKEGEVLGCGSLYNNLAESIAVAGFIYKLNANGEKLWERVFRLDLGHDEKNLQVRFQKLLGYRDLVELPNGDIIASGKVENIYEDSLSVGKTSDYDLWVIKTDKDGCMQKDCGYYQVLTAVEDLEPTPALPFKIYPNPTEGMIEIVGTYDNYEIVDLQGQVLATGAYQSTLDLNKYRAWNVPSALTS